MHLWLWWTQAEQGRTKRGPRGPQTRERRKTARHFLACGASLWRVATFKILLGAARHSLGWGALYPILQNSKLL